MELTDPASPAFFSSLEIVVNGADARLLVVPGLYVQLFLASAWKLRMHILCARKKSLIMPALCSLLLKTNYAKNYAGILFAPLDSTNIHCSTNDTHSVLNVDNTNLLGAGMYSVQQWRFQDLQTGGVPALHT